jgi:hypothetical protein
MTWLRFARLKIRADFSSGVVVWFVAGICLQAASFAYYVRRTSVLLPFSDALVWIASLPLCTALGGGA